MRAELTGLDVDDWSSVEDSECFAFHVQFFVGEEGAGGGGESFSVRVCTPSWLEHKLEEGPDPVIEGVHTVVMAEWNEHVFRRFLERYIHHCEGEDWTQVATRIGRLAHWEFDQGDGTIYGG